MYLYNMCQVIMSYSKKLVYSCDQMCYSREQNISTSRFQNKKKTKNKKEQNNNQLLAKTEE